TSGQGQHRHETPRLRLEREIPGRSSYRRNGLVAAGPGGDTKNETTHIGDLPDISDFPGTNMLPRGSVSHFSFLLKRGYFGSPDKRPADTNRSAHGTYFMAPVPRRHLEPRRPHCRLKPRIDHLPFFVTNSTGKSVVIETYRESLGSSKRRIALPGAASAGT